MMLQGVIVYIDMLLESGLIKLLLFFQLYWFGYVVYWLDVFKVLFEECYVQLFFEKGDVVFFNLVLFYVVGVNISGNIQCMVNLLQVFLVFGWVMEVIDCYGMCWVFYLVFVDVVEMGYLLGKVLDVVVLVCVEGYFFLINFDCDLFVGGFVFEIQKQLMLWVLFEKMLLGEFDVVLFVYEDCWWL